MSQTIVTNGKKGSHWTLDTIQEVKNVFLTHFSLGNVGSQINQLLINDQ